MSDRTIPAARPARATSLAFAGLAALHAGWAFAPRLPGIAPERLTDAVVGSADVPSPRACMAVAGALGMASLLVANRPRATPRAVRLGRWGVAAVLGTRATLGLAGRTDLVSPRSTSDGFRKWDRALYSPICLVLCAGSAPRPAMTRHR
jgi:hypothetical protein